MSLVTIIFLNVLLALVVTGLIAAAVDLCRNVSRSLDKRRAERACRRGWDWPAFEREVARYLHSRSGRPAAPPR